jgi:hypothetical protein
MEKGCASHRWVEAEINTCKTWRDNHMREHKAFGDEVHDLGKTIWKWGALVLTVQTVIGGLAAVAMFGRSMGWF